MLLGRLRIRGKLALLVLVPLLCMTGLTVPVVWDRATVAQRAGDLADRVRIASRVGTILQHLQQERLLAIGLLLGQVGRTDLVQKIAEVDDRIADLRAEAGDDLPAEVDTALDGVRQLAALRTAAVAGQTGPDQIMAGYGPVNTTLIDSLRLRLNADTRTPTGRQVLALDGLLRTGESLSAGATLIVLVAARPNAQTVTAYVANFAVLSEESARLQALVTPEQLDLLTLEEVAVANRTGPDFINQSALDPATAIGSLDVATLFPTVSSMITLGQFVEKKLAADVTAEVRADRQVALAGAYWVTLLIVTILIAVILLTMAVGRAVARPLTRLTRSADRVARVAESELVRVADDESETSSPVRLDPVDVGARDEIGDLARAFERVQNTAARLVERQVASRRNVAQMFGHVGRRTQNLVGRQIALIDRLEQQETEPGRLEHLYRLDHISSRLRRNAGSLVVLSGATGDDAHVAPVPVADVVRLALGEIEDYTRVDVQVPPQVVAAPAIIGDLVLALAELMENATIFSPPHTRVVVAGEPTDDGARLAVIDQGIGMSAQRLAEENARFTRRERLDLAPSEVLGLFVVGRLARRHGWTVELAATPGGGVTATLTIPGSALVQATSGRHGEPVARAALPSRDRPGTTAPAVLPSRDRAGTTAPAALPSRDRPGVGIPVGTGEPDSPLRTGRTPVTVDAGPARPLVDPAALPGFDPTLVGKATRSMAATGPWDAFGTVPAAPEPTLPAGPDGLPVRPAGQPADAPVLPVRGTATVAPVDADPSRTAALPADTVPAGRAAPPASTAPAAPPAPLTGIRQRVPGASLPRTAPVVGPVDATHADPAAARALVEQFQSGVQRAEQAVPAADHPAEPATPRLTRRIPGANLTVSPPRQPPSQHPGDPGEVRDLINAFETGVARALREVRTDRRTEEGTTR
ncbi:nitrate- and nitrite sensing domain-containing protein [Micromonospora rifamycinica]|uniref:histidine kinase n=1 Tax=Micromonospora rifamycinica TaxID=291594 RepID=A0A109IM50_9ACTN|nr:nitrate- and nitrite sensing domain-containing protein [Micromonospora rifamycinica]KWV33091.1 histidine kinase [Micromonospora rifamycinica]SCG77463.1 Signal transduction histidine kinase [Micromonospora rifamycinica]